MATKKSDINHEGRSILEELFQESLERERKFSLQEKAFRRRLMIVLGKVKTVEPLTVLESPTGKKSKLGELMKGR